LRTRLAFAFIILWLVAALIFVLWNRRQEILVKSNYVQTQLPELLYIFLIIYFLMLVLGKLVLEPNFPISDRTLALPYIVIAIITANMIVSLAHSISARNNTSPRQVRRLIYSALFAVFIATILLVGTMQLTHSLSWAVDSHNDGLGYSSKAWREASVIRYLQNLSVQPLMYSNVPDAIWFLTPWQSALLPNAAIDQFDRIEVSPEITAMTQSLERHGGLIVYFRGISWRETMGEGQFRQLVDTVPIIGDESSSIFGVDPVHPER
jgi:hypothetical protein